MGPTYVGKRRSSMQSGWFSGLAAWWNAYTPEYVTGAQTTRLPQPASIVGPPDTTRVDKPPMTAPDKQATADAPSASTS